MDTQALEALVREWFNSQPSLRPGTVVEIKFVSDNHHVKIYVGSELLCNILEGGKKGAQNNTYTLTRHFLMRELTSKPWKELTIKDFLEKYTTQSSFKRMDGIGQSCVGLMQRLLKNRGFVWPEN